MSHAISMPTDQSLKSWSAYFDAQDSTKGLPLAFTETAHKMHFVAHLLIAITVVLIGVVSAVSLSYIGDSLSVNQQIFLIACHIVNFAICGCLLYLAKRYLERDYDADPAFRKMQRDKYLQVLLKEGLFAAEMRYIQCIGGNSFQYETYSQHYFEQGGKDIIDMLTSPAFNDHYKKICERPARVVLDKVRMDHIGNIKAGICQKKGHQKLDSQNWVDFSLLSV